MKAYDVVDIKSSMYSYPRHQIRVSGQLHTPAALFPVKQLQGVRDGKIPETLNTWGEKINISCTCRDSNYNSLLVCPFPRHRTDYSIATRT
jgi:hypothetical protein